MTVITTASQTSAASYNVPNPTQLQGDLASCVQAILCGLTSATRNALGAILKGYIAELDAEAALLTVQLAELELLTAVPQVAYNLVQGVISTAKAGANIVPIDLIGQCIQVGNLNIAIQQNLNIILADAQVIANDLSRLLSLQNEIQADLANIRTTITFFQKIIATLDVCPQT